MDVKKKIMYMIYLHSYETYVTMNFPDLYDEPVLDYVDTDYYIFDIEDDDTKPKNQTGYDDRETKNKKKKSVYFISPS